jgi:hypothetical protein
MNPNVLKLFYAASKKLRLEITYKLGLDQRVSADTLGFIKQYQGSPRITNPLDPTLLQIIAWDNDTPISIFRESSEAFNPDARPEETKSLYAFFVNTLNYLNYKTCKHAKSKKSN